MLASDESSLQVSGQPAVAIHGLRLDGKRTQVIMSVLSQSAIHREAHAPVVMDVTEKQVTAVIIVRASLPQRTFSRAFSAAKTEVLGVGHGDMIRAMTIAFR